MALEFTGCKNLCYDKKRYPACKLNVLANGGKPVAVWFRPPVENGPSLNQFCTVLGRLPAQACLERHKAFCSSYEEVIHSIPEMDIDD